MASNTHKPFPTRKLAQLLQEKQEPFKLKIYLLERGYLRKPASAVSFGSYDDSSKLFTLGFYSKRRKMVSRFSKTLRTLANKLVSVKNVVADSEQRINMEKELTIRSNLCSAQIATHRGKYTWSCMENKQQLQLSPVSVLEEVDSDQNSLLHNVEEEISNDLTKKPNNIFSLEKSLPADQRIDSEISLNYSKIKSQLWRTPQLLFDCTLEVIQIDKLNNSKKQQQDFLGGVEIQRLLHENVLKCSKQSTKSGSKTSAQLIDYDIWASFDDWKYDSHEQRIRIAKVLSDSILDEMLISEFLHQVIFKPKGL